MLFVVPYLHLRLDCKHNLSRIHPHHTTPTLLTLSSSMTYYQLSPLTKH